MPSYVITTLCIVAAVESVALVVVGVVPSLKVISGTEVRAKLAVGQCLSQVESAGVRWGIKIAECDCWEKSGIFEYVRDLCVDNVLKIGDY